MEKEVKYDRTELGMQNFTKLDKFVFWSWGFGLAFILICFFFAIWVDFSPLMVDIIFSIILLIGLNSIYMRLVWVEPEITYDITYREKYSKIINENLDYPK